MAGEKIGQLAESIGTPLDRLLLQIEEAGLPQRSVDDVINENDKESLLAHLKKSHGEEGTPRKITLKRTTRSTLKASGTAGRGRTVNVEVRKKRTYVRRTEVDQEQEVSPAKNVGETPVPIRRSVSDADVEIERKRHLFRLWIRNDDLRPLPRQVRHNLLGIEVDGFTPIAPLDATAAA